MSDVVEGLELAMRERGYTIRERAPDPDSEFVTKYTVERGGVEATFWVTDGIAFHAPIELIDKIDKEIAAYALRYVEATR